jgi:hypothetical protein
MRKTKRTKKGDGNRTFLHSMFNPSDGRGIVIVGPKMGDTPPKKRH